MQCIPGKFNFIYNNTKMMTDVIQAPDKHMGNGLDIKL
jgi:hypothetical protein